MRTLQGVLVGSDRQAVNKTAFFPGVPSGNGRNIARIYWEQRPEGRFAVMKIVIIRSPRLFRPLLKRFFGIGKGA